MSTLVALEPLVVRAALDKSIDGLKLAAFHCNSELVRLKLRRAYKHLQMELEQIDTDVLLALEQEAV